MRAFLPPPNAIRAQGAIDIDAQPELVAGVYRGVYRLLKPLIAEYVRGRARRQMENYVLVPLKAAAEKQG
jgi:hypothetical protein